MGSAGFVGDEESRPSSNSKKFKLPKKIPDDRGAVNYSSVPKKLRSAIKKRACESIAPTLPISRKNNDHLSNGVATLKSGAKKSKLSKKQKRITKDEREVAETLYALSDMFSDHASKTTNKQLALELDDEPSETKPSTILEDGKSITATEDNGIPALQEESKQISTNVTFEAVSHSVGNAQKPELPCIKQSDTHSAFENQYYPKEGRNNGGLFQSAVLSATGDPSSKIQLPPWLKNAANCTSSQPPCTADKYPQIVVESKKSLKRCSAHVNISRLIKDLQISKGERKDGGGGLLEKRKPSQSRTTTTTTHRGGGNSFVSYNGGTTHSTEIQNATFSETSSTKLVSDFLSLGHSSSHEAPLRNYQLSYLQPQRHSNCTPFSQPRTNFQGSSISDVAAAQQVVPTPYLSSAAMAEPWGQQRRMMIPPQLQLQTRQQQYKYNNNNDGGATLAEWQQNPNALLNYAAQPSFRHLGSSKYQQLSPSQQQQQLMAAINSSRLDHRHHLQQLQERCFFATPTNLM